MASKASSAEVKDVPSEGRTWKSGVHQLEAICGTDTLQQKFTLFSIKDTHPMEPTTEWYYQTAKTFPHDGKPVYVQVGSSENGAHIVYSIIAGNKLLEKGAWELGDSIVTLPFTYREEYASGVVINYSFVKNGECYARKISIARPLPEKKLNITWKTFRDRLTPGQKEKWTLQITTPDGKPAKAQLMSVLYDKSLDQLAEHSWKMSLGLSQWLPSCYWKSNLKYYKMDLLGVYPTKYFDQKQLDVDKFDGKYFSYYAYMEAVERSYFATVEAVRIQKDELVRDEAKVMRIRGSKMTRFGAASSKPLLSEMDLALQNKMVMLEEFGGGGSNKVLSSADEAALNHVQVRENLNETAFFYPALESDNNGNVAIRFTLPESVTTWKFMGLAHDKEMRNGLLVDEAVAQKTVMVQPNMPRFLREGDKSSIVVKLFNTSDKKVSGNARMQILDAETQKVVWQKTQNYSINAEGSATVSFDVQGLKEGVYINKVVAAGNGYSDGEQHYLPVLSDRELVVNTLPITLHQQGEQSFDLSKLFLDKEGKQAKGTEEAKVTVEYTNNPSWLMIKALPAISNPDDEDAISLMSAIYANTITTFIQKKLSLETSRLQNQVEKLKKLQNADGSFSWWKGMKGSRSMTTAVAEMMVRLNAIAGTQKSISKMLTSAINYLSWQTAREVREMKKMEEKKHKVSPSEQALHYLYILSMDGRKMKENFEQDQAYLLDKMSKMTSDFTIYGKARAAVVLAKNSQQNAAYREKAGEYLQSVNEYAVYREEMGRYYDTHKALYSWRNYKIPTQVSVIEAMQLLKPNDKQTIEELQRWLLMSKRTQVWDTPVNTVDAVYAFMKGNESNWNKKAENAVLKLDGKLLPMPQDSTMLGYIKTEKVGKASTLNINKKSDYTSWGAVYAEFKQPLSEIASSESGIKVRRVVVTAESQGKEKSLAKVGEKVKVTLIITADRDYDFVEIEDKRAACLEPVNQQSGYQWGMGCYVSPKDNTTNFYFDRLSKGKHVVEMEYYVDRNGEYQAGSCSARCAYSPEFCGRDIAYKLSVNE